MKFAKRFLAAFLAATPFLTVLPVAHAEGTKIKVACVGDSITQGLGNTPYPTRLQTLLGDGYEVQNFGLWGTTGCSNTGRPYTTCDDSCYQKSLDYQPDIVVLMIGTNDGNEASIAYSEEHFKEDMTSLIQSYLSLASKPKLYLLTPPHAYLAGNASVNSRIAPMVRELAKELSLPLVDMNALTENMPENFQDQLHPSETGYFLVALRIYEQVFGGAVSNVTVRTEPKASVKLNAYACESDENGLVTFPMAKGKQMLQVQKEGFEPAYTAVTVDKACEISCVLHQTANIARTGVAFASTGEDISASLDGDFATGWQSETKEDGMNFGYTTENNRTISSVTVLWETATRPTADESGFTVELTTDGETWKQVADPVYSFGDGTETALDTVTFAPTPAKGVRVVLHSFTNEKYAPKVYEFGVYGENAGKAEVTVTPLPDGGQSGEKEKGLPVWVIPVGIGLVAAVLLACVIWAILLLRRK